MVKERFELTIQTLKRIQEQLQLELESSSHIIAEAIMQGNKVLWCGNGGSAAQAMHFSTELTVKYKNPRQPFPSLPLPQDPVYLTAISNDLSFENSFSRLVQAFGKAGDVLVALSTSGKSKNVNEAVKQAKKMGLKVIYLTGLNPSEVEEFCDIVIHIPSTETPVIQECHEVVGHILIELIEKKIGELS
ncbi:MAG: SIS domain-containing protein [candidate division WOR-3 bacterium]